MDYHLDTVAIRFARRSRSPGRWIVKLGTRAVPRHGPGHSHTGSRDPFILRRVLRLQAQHVKLPFLDLSQTRKEIIEVVRDREKPPG